MRLEDKTAIVTGAGSGLGKAIAKRFAQEGANIVIAEIRPEAGKKVKDEIEEIGRDALFVETDVSDSEDVKHMVSKTLDEFGKIDILVNNAGILIQKTIQEMTEEDWDRIMNTNLKGVFICTKHTADHMIERGEGKIINMASMAANISLGTDCGYCSTKGGVISFTISVGNELAPHGINVNAIGPGLFDTPMNEEDLKDEEFKEFILDRTPIGQIGQPEDVASAALFLASEESDFVVGQTIYVDGGFLTQ